MSEEFGSKQIIRGTAITSLLTIVSRILGFFRDLIVATIFGAGPLADAYFVAFRIPNLLRSFVAEGAMSAAFVPIFSTELKKGLPAAQTSFSAVAAFLIATTVALTVIGVVFADQLVALIAPGFAAPDRELCILLTRIMLPYIVFVSLIAMFNGALTSLKSFGAAAAAQSIMNVVLIAGGLLSALFEPRTGIIVLSASVFIGGAIQVICQIPTLRKAGLTLSFKWRGTASIIRELLGLMAPALLGATIYQVIIFLATVLASLLEPGAVSWLFYADRVVQLPIGIFSIALGSVLLPALSHNAAANNNRSFAENLINSMRFTSFILIPLTFFIFLFAEEISTLLFERGAFDTHASKMTASAIRALSLGIWSISCQSLLVRACMARRDNVTPTVFGVLTLCVNVCVSLLLMGPIHGHSDSFITRGLQALQSVLYSFLPVAQSYGHVGLASASSVAAGISFIALIISVSVREAEINWDPFVAATSRAIIAGSVAAYLSWIAAHQFPLLSVKILIGALSFAASYGVVAYLIRSQESLELTKLILKKVK